MSLLITKINESSTNIDYKYLDSEHVFGFTLKANYSFSIQDVEFRDGEHGILSGIEALKQAYLRRNIAAKIGVDEFRNGVVKSISIPDSNGIRFQKASIEIEEEVKVDEDNVLTELFGFIPSPQDLSAFAEDFSFSRSNDSYSYSRSISLKWKNNLGNQFLNNARLFLKNVYLGNRPPYGFQQDGISEYGRFNLNLKPKISETYDEINNELKFEEQFESKNISSLNGMPFSVKSTHNLSVSEAGYTNKNYSIEVMALTEPLESNILSGVQYVLGDVISENSGFYGNPINLEKTINSDGGVAALSLSFSNDPRINSLNNIEYVVSKSQDQSSFDSYDFSTTIKSRGKNHLIAFNNALNFFSGNRDLAYTKIPILFGSFESGSVFEVSRNTSISPFEASISESISFSSNPIYSGNAYGFLSTSVSINDTLPVNRTSIVPLYGDKELIISNTNAKTLATRSISVDVVGTTGDLELNSLRIASGYQPNYDHNYMVEKITVLSPLDGKCSASINFNSFND